MEPTPREHPRFRIIPRPSDQLVIFFSGSSAPDHHFHWWKIANRIDANVILINNGLNQWYQQGVPGLGDSYEETLDTLRAWITALGVKRVYTCGASMGGSAALMYGGPLDAAVLGFGFEPHMNYPFGHVQRIMDKSCPIAVADSRPLARDSRKPVLVYAGENYPADVLGAHDLMGFPAVSVSTVRRCGHDLALQLRRAGDLDPIIDAFLADRPPPKAKAAGRACEIPEDPSVLYAAECATLSKEWESAESHARRAIALYPSAEWPYLLLGQALLRLGRPAEAIPYLSAALSLHPDLDQAEFLLGNALRKIGELFEAVRIHRRRIKRNPNAHSSHYDIGLIYQKLGNVRKAQEEFQTAIKLSPRTAGYKARLDALA